MTDLHKAAQQALEALENSIDDMRHLYETDWRKGLPTRATQLAAMKAELDKHEAAITALREALAAPQPDSTAIHSCSYYCDRPDCIKAQRDELREALAKPVVPEGWQALQAAAYITICEAIESTNMALLSRGPTQAQASETAEWLRDMIAAAPKPVVPPGYALVPVAALKWLHGEEGEFDCPPEGYFRGKPAPYWWRSVFRKMCASAPQPKDKP